MVDNGQGTLDNGHREYWSILGFSWNLGNLKLDIGHGHTVRHWALSICHTLNGTLDMDFRR